MGFHRPLETDGTPAPSPRFEEMDNLARNWARRQTITVETLPADNLVVAVQQAELNYDQFMAIVGITYRCEQWHAFCVRVGIAGSECIIPTDTLAGWWDWYRVFCADDDATDQANTQADALT